MIEIFHKKRKNKIEKRTTEITRKDGTKPSLTEDILNLVLKIFIIIALFWSLFVFVFGLHQVEETGMSPSIKPEDIIMYYRLDKNYDLLDPVVLKVKDTVQVRRVVAKAGDTVDITAKGLVVNGSLQTGLEKDFVNGDTLPYKQGITFPITIKKGEVFLLGDNRQQAQDSRIYGPVKIKDTMGKLMWDLRRRNL